MEYTEEVENKQYGEKFEYEPEGPFQKNRVKTDFYWFVGFVAYLVAWSVVIIYAFANGDIGKFTEPTDSEGRVCGREADVYEKPYLVYYKTDFWGESRSVCQEACPTEDFQYQDGQYEVTAGSVDTLTEDTTIASANENTNESGASTESVLKAESSEENGKAVTRKSTPTSTRTVLEETKRKMICKADVKIEQVTTWEQLDYLVRNDKCASTYAKATSVESNRCLTEEIKLLKNISDTWNKDSGSAAHTNAHLSKSKWSIISFILLSGIISVACIILMRWYALSFVFGSMFVLCISIFYCIYETFVLEGDPTSRTGGILLSLFLCIVVLVVVVLLAIYFRNQISLACEMITESSKAVTCISAIFAVPFILFFIYLLILTLGISTSIELATIDRPIYKAEFADEFESCQCSSILNYRKDSTCYPDIFKKECRTKNGSECVLSGCYLIGKQPESVGFFHFMNFIGLFWSYYFIVGFGDMILAGVFSTWYFTFNKKILTYTSIVESFWIVGTYHLGTIAFGSLIILICAIIKAILGRIKRRLEKMTNPCSVIVLLNFKGLFNLLEGFFNFINRRAYIMCAIHGTDFMQSAKAALYLVMRNVKKVVVVHQVTNFMLLLLTVIIAYVTYRLSLSYFSIRTDLTSGSTSAYIVLLGSLLVVWLTMRLVNIAIDTIFLCFLEDSERNDGSDEKPYFMSDELSKLIKQK